MNVIVVNMAVGAKWSKSREFLDLSKCVLIKDNEETKYKYKYNYK